MLHAFNRERFATGRCFLRLAQLLSAQALPAAAEALEFGRLRRREPLAGKPPPFDDAAPEMLMLRRVIDSRKIGAIEAGHLRVEFQTEKLADPAARGFGPVYQIVIVDVVNAG